VSFKKIRLVPVLLAFAAIAIVCFVQSMRFWRAGATGAERLELVTFDWRAQRALEFNPPVATNLAFLAITDRTIKSIKKGNEELGLDGGYGLYWPRHLYGRVVRELSQQGARGVGFDIIFSERRDDLGGIPKYTVVTNAELNVVTNFSMQPSDDFFIDKMRDFRNVAIACTPGLVPFDDFLTAANVGHISSSPDSDGVVRRTKPFQTFRLWDSDIEEMLRDKCLIDLHQHTEAHEDHILFQNSEISYRMSLTNGRFDLLQLTKDHLPEYVDAVPEEGRWRIPFQEFRMWHMGIVMAAMEIGLDLEHAKIGPREIFIPGTNGVDRTIPLDYNGNLIIDWAVPLAHKQLLIDMFEWLILNDTEREYGNAIPEEEKFKFRDKLVFIGSSATGNELTDRGSTPLGFDEFLVSKHWNVANMFIVDRFVKRSEMTTELAIIIVLGILAGLITFFSRPPWSTLGMFVAGALYGWWCVDQYVSHRMWLPLVTPVAGGLFGTHFAVVVYQLVFENQERQRIKGVFSKLVSPNVVNTLLQQDEVHLGGSRREITVFFSDVRGFTTMTDEMQKYADDYVAEHKLVGEEAEQFRDKVAAETLDTVNMYLARIADQIKKHDGTLDKYIGDCVMAFWGAPTPNEKHAVACVRSTIDAQLAMHELNLVRKEENVQIELENERRVARGEPPTPLKRLLVMGSGVNSGMAIVGLMGSEDHIFNFTVFGREVNLASRLEHVSGRSRIIIGEGTFRDLEKHEPELANTCEEQDPVQVKGIKGDVRNWEVPWRIYLPENTPAKPNTVPLPEGVKELTEDPYPDSQFIKPEDFNKS
jgi:class 3 adenylate cyclase/CHASE2 domain-containing sensor protein